MLENLQAINTVVYFNDPRDEDEEEETLQVILSPTNHFCAGHEEQDRVYSFPYGNGVQYAARLQTEKGEIWLVLTPLEMTWFE